MSGSVLNILREVLPENRIQRVLRALRYDPMIWKTVQNEDFLREVTEAVKSSPELWSPAGLALIKIGYSKPSSYLGAPIDDMLDEDLENRSTEFFNAVLDNQIETAVTLDQAVMAAVALRIKFQQQRNWDFLADLINLRSDTFWDPVFACLFGLISEPFNMIQWMISTNKSEKIRLIGIHSLLSNPLPFIGQVNILSQIFSEMRSEERLDLLKKLSRTDQVLVQSVSEKLIDIIGISESLETADYNSLKEVYETAELLRLAGKYDQALPLLDSAQKITENLQENLAIQIGLDASQSEQDEIAKTAFDRVRSSSESKTLEKPALQTTEELEKALLSDPNNIHSLITLTKRYIAAGNFEKALESASLASALSPANIKVRRIYADALGASSLWDQAESAYKTITSEPTATSDDFAALAIFSLQNGNSQASIEAASKALEMDQVNPNAHLALGKALLEEDKLDQGIFHLNKAVEIDPKHSEAWILLADHHLKQDRVTVAIEKLTAAVKQIPENPEINFMLGELHEINNDPNLSLKYYSKASDSIEPSNNTLAKKINLRYGQVLLSSDHFKKAKYVLDSAYQSDSTDQETISLYAKALLESDNPELTIVLLSDKINNKSATPEMRLDYARSLILTGKDLEEAENIINRSIDENPNNSLALITKAELFSSKGDYESAISTYKNVIKNQSGLEETQRIRAHLGLAAAARKNGQSDLGIAVLETLRDSTRNRPRVLKVLHDQYKSDGLKMKANEILNQLIIGCQDDSDTLLWAAEQASKAGDHNLAVTALTFAHELSGNKSELLTKLGQEYINNQDLSSAKACFKKLLEMEGVPASDYEKAARSLMELDQVETIPYLSKAIEQDHTEKTSLLSDLVKIYLDKGDFKSAQNALEEQLTLDPDNVDILSTKSDLHLRMQETDKARSTISKIIELAPNDTSNRIKASEVYIESGDVEAAISNAAEVLRLEPENIEIRLDLIKLYFENLSFSSAYDLCLNTTEDSMEMDNYHALLAILLDKQEILSVILKKYEGIADFRWTSLKVIDLVNSGEYSKAHELYVSAWSDWQDFQRSMNGHKLKAESILGLVLSALSTQRWEDALQLARVYKNAADEPLFSNYLLARLFVELAEYQELCNNLNVQVNGPGAITLSPSYGQECRQAIESAGMASKTADSKKTIDNLQIRCSYLFSNSAPTHKQSQNSSEELAAALAVSHKTGTAYSLEGVDHELLNNPRVHIQLAINLMDSEPSDAFDHALIAYESRSGDPLYLAALALAAEKAGDLQIAMNSINQALLHWSNEPHWHAFAGRVMHRLGYQNNAIHSLEQAIQIDPNQASYYLDLGTMYLGAGNYEDAIRILEIATGLAPKSVDVWKNLAKAYSHMNLSVESREALEKVFNLEQQGVSSLIFAVETALISSDFDAANKYIRSAETASPSNPDVVRLKAKLYAATNRFDEAIQLYDKAISLSKNKLPLQIEKVNLVSEQKSNTSGLELLLDLVAEYPKEPLVYKSLCDAFEREGKLDKAIQAARHALKLNNNSLSNQELLELKYQLGKLSVDQGQLDQAIQLLEEIILKSPGNVNAYLDISRAYQLRREHQKALEYVQQAIEIAPLNPLAYKEAGLLYKEGKDYISAESMLRKAADLNPRDLEVQRLLAAVVALNLIHNPHRNEVK